MAASAGLAREKIRSVNQGVVLNAIHRATRISRSDLATELQLSPATLTAITGTLIEAGLVYEDRQGVSKTVGRKPILLAVNYGHAHVVGFKVSNVGVTAVLADLNAEVLASCFEALEHHDLETVLKVIERLTALLCAEVGFEKKELVGLGVNLPGIVEQDTGRVRHSALLNWSDTPLAQLLEERLSLPTLVENDVNALAVAEAWFGSGKQHEDFLVVTLGRGVGLGIVIGGEVYRGPRGGAGEFGHSVLDSSGPESRHTQQGSVEAYLSDYALLEQARRNVPGFPNEATPDTLLEFAQQGHVEAVAVLEGAGETLGLALSTLVNIFAPSLIILSGEGMRSAEFMLPRAKASLSKHAFGDLAKHVHLVVDNWGEDAWARGAAALAASRYLTEAASLTGGD